MRLSARGVPRLIIAPTTVNIAVSARNGPVPVRCLVKAASREWPIGAVTQMFVETPTYHAHANTIDGYFRHIHQMALLNVMRALYIVLPCATNAL